MRSTPRTRTSSPISSPRATGGRQEAKQARSAAIASATAAAARPPVEVVTLWLALLAAALQLLPLGNRNVLSDVAAAAEATRAAAVTARVNIEVNLGAITDPRLRAEFETVAGSTVEKVIEGTDAVTDAVRKEIAK